MNITNKNGNCEHFLGKLERGWHDSRLELSSRKYYSETCLVRTSKGTQSQYLFSEVLTIRVGYVHEVYTGTE